MVDYVVPFGAPKAGWFPVAGDWDGNRVNTMRL